MSSALRKPGMQRTRRPAVALIVFTFVAAFGAPGARAASPGAASGVARSGVLIQTMASNGPATSMAPRAALPHARVVAPAAQPVSTFKVNYTGFTPAAKAAFQVAVDYWAGTLSSSVPITVNATFIDLGDETDEGITLGQAGPVTLRRDFVHASAPQTFYPGALANRQAGYDLDPTRADMVAEFTSNPGASWYFGTDALPAPTQLDFVSVVMHELAHGLGFFGSMEVDSSGIGSYGFSGYPVIFDRFARRGVTNKSLLSYANNSKSLGQQLVSGDVYFKGAVTPKSRLYAPIPYEPGSSFSHLDEDVYGPTDPNALMTPRIGYGEGAKSAGPITLDIFRDMGWSVPSRTAPHDLTADAFNDLIARTPAGELSINPGNGSGGILPAVPVGSGFSAYNKVMVTPDWNGDGRSDLIARSADGRLWLYPLGNGPTSAVPIASGWKSFTAVVAPGDFNRDDKPDVIARTADGKLRLYRGNGVGGFIAPPVQIAVGWKAFTAIVAPGDFNGDGRADLIVRTAEGRLQLYRGNGSNGFIAPPVQIATGWKAFTAVVAPGDFSGDGQPDLIARTSAGALKLYRGNGSNGLRPVLAIGTGYNGLTLG